ncbi:transposase [Streptomyces sp. NBC_01571]|nr:transposase [Streptomyces sp. NBC_01571]
MTLERNKTITCLAGAETVVGARTAAAQRLQYFLSESVWDTEQVNGRRLDLMRGQTATAPHADGVIVIDDSGDPGTARPPHMWVGSSWAGWARPTTASSR